MVLDKVETLVEKHYLIQSQDNYSEDNSLKITQQVASILKSIKEKLQQIVLKDTNASVRDQGVSLIGLLKIIIT